MSHTDPFDELRRAIVDSAAESRAEMRRHIAESAAERRRHFDVVAEGLERKIQIVAEGVIALSEPVDGVADEMHDGFGTVDRRFLHLEARLEHRFSDIERRPAAR